MAENGQQQARSPSQIAAAHKGSVHGQETEQQHGGRSPSAIAAAAHGGVHGPDTGPDRGIEPLRSPSQIAADALRSVVDSTDGGHVLHSDGERSDGKSWVEWLQDRDKNSQGDGGNPPPHKGRSLPEEQRQKQKEQEKDKGPSRMEQAYERTKEAVQHMEQDWECHGY